MENKICVYAICKNEEQFVEKWVKSMSEADKIVVLDTGSTDNTVQKLKDLGVEVKVQIVDPWRFDVARNLSLEMVPEDCNICVCTDLDEVLEPGWAKPLREQWVEGVHERGIYMYTWSHLENGNPGREFLYDKVHSKKWIWNAPVHELLVDKETKSNHYSYDHVLDLSKEMHLHHYPDKTKSRDSYLPLLELRKQEMEDDYYGLIYLAHEYCYKGFYEKSIAQLQEILERYNDTMNSVERASCYLFMGDCHASLADQLTDEQEKNKKLQEAANNYSIAINVDITYREPYLNLAKVYIKMKDYSYAEFIVKRGLQKSYRHYTWVERDTSWSHEPWDLLCIAAYYAGHVKDSVIYASKALMYEPENERFQSNLKLCTEALTDEELIK